VRTGPFLTAVEWVDDWPVVRENRYDVSPQSNSFEDRFSSSSLHPRWIAPGVDPKSFAHLSDSGLVLDAGREANGVEAVHLLGVRASSDEWMASVDAVGDVSLVVRIDNAHWAGVQRVGASLEARVVIGAMDKVLAIEVIPEDALPAIRTMIPESQHGESTGPDTVELGYLRDGFRRLAMVDGRYISTEVAGGFTGRVIGLEAIGARATVRSFSYADS
jgi:hypothetical protein